MAHDHVHDHSHDALRAAPEVARALQIAVGLLLALTAIGAALWWPSGGVSLPEGIDGGGRRVDATVIGDTGAACAGPDFGATIECVEIRLEITSGPNRGSTGSFQVFPQPGTPEFETGDKLVVNEFELDTGELAHTFADYQRDRPLLLLAALFVAAVVALGRLQGVRAIGGLVVSAIVLLVYVFPALLGGEPPLGVALVASAVIAFAALYLAHGVSHTTTVALLGTMGALALTGILAAIFTAAAEITGAASEDQIYLLVSSEGIDLRGLVLAGIVLGSLGVLDDVTVTQVSAVARLREANPSYGIRELYRTGVHIGRDHIASTVNTLVLAYAGAALPLLLFTTNIGIPLSESVTSEVVAVEVVRTLVGSIGLVAAVPITTVLAAIVVTGTGFRRRGDDPDPEPDPRPAPAAPPETPARRRRTAGRPDGGQRPSRPPEQPAEPPSDTGWDDFTPTAEDF